MDVVFLVVTVLLGGKMEAEAVSVTGKLGGEVQITCSHSNAYSNVKYFCGGACASADVLITSAMASNHNKYSIRDQGNTFYVTVSDLTLDDQGTYWCGVDRFGVDTYTRVTLTVLQGPTEDKDMQESISSTFSKQLIYTGTGLVLLLVSAVLLLLVFLIKKRKRNSSTSSGEQNDSTGASKEVAGVSTTAGRHSLSDSAANVYSNVTQSQSHVTADGLLYSTISFTNRLDDSGDAAAGESVTYAAVSLESADEATLNADV